MSARRQVDKRITALREVREIMNAMKNLALLESRKVSRSLGVQRETRRHLEDVGARFLLSYPQAWVPASAASVVLVLGAERGFCGDYNKRLTIALADHLRSEPNRPSVILVGHRLGASARPGVDDVVRVDGATVSEDIADTLTRVANAVTSRHARLAPSQVVVIRHTSELGPPVVEPLLAEFNTAATSSQATAIGPELTLEPEEFFTGLVEAYLIAHLREMLSTALAAESLYRVQHLSGAITHLERRIEELSRRSRMLRQEETIEEIEVLLLGTDMIAPPRVRKTSEPSKRR